MPVSTAEQSNQFHLRERERERGSGNEKQKTGMKKGTGTSTYTHPREAITLISAERKERAPLVDIRERENYLTHS